jgi:hypothetical protein
MVRRRATQRQTAVATATRFRSETSLSEQSPKARPWHHPLLFPVFSTTLLPRLHALARSALVWLLLDFLASRADARARKKQRTPPPAANQCGGTTGRAPRGTGHWRSPISLVEFISALQRVFARLERAVVRQHGTIDWFEAGGAAFA